MTNIYSDIIFLIKKLKALFCFIFLSCVILLSSCGKDEVPGVVTSEEVTISFKDASISVSEGSSSIFVPLSISGSTSQTVVVTYEVQGTADFPGDVTPLTNTSFLIAPGATAFNMEFIIVDDNVLELESETLTITLISVSEGGALGTQKTLDINIEPDDVLLTSFSKSSSTIQDREDISINLELSKSYSEDLSIRLSYDIAKNVSGEDYFTETSQDIEIVIPSGQTTGSIRLFYNQNFNQSLVGVAGTIEIWRVELSGGGTASDVIPHPDRATHVINVVPDGDGLIVEMEWVSTNQDVDLDMGLFLASGGSPLLTSTEAGFDGRESFQITDDVADGDYRLVVSWFEGTGTADMTLTITPYGNATWVGSGDSESITFENIDEASFDTRNIFASILKTGNTYQ